MYAGERPLVAGLLGQAGINADRATESLYGPRGNLPLWMEGYMQGPGGMWNVGSVAPTQMSLQLLESLAQLGQKPTFGVSTPSDYLMPILQLGLNLGQQQTKFGKGASALDILRGDLPLPSWVRPYVPVVGRAPSNIYADQSFLAQLIRSMRGPFKVNQQTLLQQQQRYGSGG